MSTRLSPLSLLIDDLERIVSSTSAADVPALLGDLERIRAMAWAKLHAPHAATQAPSRAKPKKDRSLSPKEAAEMLGVNVRWVYDHASELPGMQRLSARCVRFSESDLRRYLEARRS